MGRPRTGIPALAGLALLASIAAASIPGCGSGSGEDEEAVSLEGDTVDCGCADEACTRCE